MSNVQPTQHPVSTRPDVLTPPWTITHEHAHAVLSAAVAGKLCTCGSNTAAASHHTPACPYRLMLESAQILSLIASTDVTHYKGHASLAEMVGTHVSAFRELIWRAACDDGGGTHRKGADADNADAEAAIGPDDPIQDLVYINHELIALADIESACRKDLSLPIAIAAPAAPPRAGKPVAWKTTHKAVCVPITEDIGVAELWRTSGYEVIELFDGTVGTSTAAGGGARVVASEVSEMGAGQIAAALSECDFAGMSIGDKVIIQAAIGRLRADAPRAESDAVIAAARVAVRDALDDVDVHPCDTHDDAVRARGLSDPMRTLWLALGNQPTPASQNADDGAPPATAH
jgi:hypothetical protein